MKAKLSFGLLGLLLIGLDQWTKAWVVSHIGLGETQPFLPGLFSLTYLQNFGAAFSMLQNQQWLFTIITLAVLGAATYYFARQKAFHFWKYLGLTLVIAGGIGNFIDRLRLGYVVDMVDLDFMNFAIFNLADACLTVGVILVMLALWKEEV
ncbi:signal peptidase II [Streptococcus caprae]|uniref:Lipoprotein signal peptidase n=1 Tax=Streptococcus caprae TaxID=1640501 RepID=A0ABV8CYZ4_9STRE